MSGPGVFHLISAHEVVPNHRLYPRYVSLCGVIVETSRLSGTDCPNECECEDPGNMACCLACVRAAIDLNRKAGVDEDCPAGIGVRTGR